MPMKRNLLFIIVSSLLLLAACTQSTPAATEAAQPPQTAAEEQTVTPSVVPSATQTEIPLPTATPTLAPTASPMPTLTSTPFTAFDDLDYVGAAYGPSNLTYLLFSVADVSGKYLLKVEDRTLDCAPSETYADLLVCEAEDFAPSYGALQCDFYSADTEELLYSQVFTHVASEPTVAGNPPWAISWTGGNTCPIVREDVKCETEWRTYGSTKCMISSCFNDCGHLYSIDSCVGLTGDLKFHGQWDGILFDPYYALNWAPSR